MVYIKEDIEIFKNDTIHIVGKVSEIEKDLDIDVFEFATYINNKRVFIWFQQDCVYWLRRVIWNEKLTCS